MCTTLYFTSVWHHITKSLVFIHHHIINPCIHVALPSFPFPSRNHSSFLSHALHLGFSSVAVERVHRLQISWSRLEAGSGAHLSDAAISTLIYSEIQSSALNVFSPRKSLSKLWSVDAYRGAFKRPIQVRGSWVFLSVDEARGCLSYRMTTVPLTLMGMWGILSLPHLTSCAFFYTLSLARFPSFSSY